VSYCYQGSASKRYKIGYILHQLTIAAAWRQTTLNYGNANTKIKNKASNLLIH